ncbi:MAG: arylsulfatase [Planctomycetota bacterium]|jgi:arylsulfatase A-like enzyme
MKPKELTRRRFLTVAAGSAVAAMIPSSGCQSELAHSPGASPKRPNIIFIMVDDMGWADLGCYGSKAISTPNIDRMAGEGIRFTDAYSGCTVCAPARSVLMTGFHTGHTSVRSNTSGVPLEHSDITIAEVLKQAGYTCGGFGKWGLGDVRTSGVPEKQGFDVFFGYYHQIHAHDYWTDYLWRNSEKIDISGEKGSAERYTHYRIFEQTMDFIRQNKDKPFFCYAPWTPPHGKFQIPEDEPAWAMYKDKEWPKDARVAAAMDTMVDEHVGELLALLKELGIDERTVVFFCSDNGAAFRFEGVLDSSGPLRGRKRDMYEGGIRVPMIVRWPGKIQAGQVSDHVWYLPDVMPTLAELAGAGNYVPSGIDGISAVPTLLGRAEEQKKHEYLYWEWHLYDWSKRKNVPNGLMQAVRMGKWKAVRHRSDEAFELYDLEKDVGEQSNLAGRHPWVVKKIEAYIKRTRLEPRPQIEPEMQEGKMFR